MGKLQEAILYSALVGIGWASAPVVQWMWRQTTSGDIRCVADVCVGDAGERVLRSHELSVKVGGFSAVECGTGPESQWISWDEYVFSNARCDLSDKVIAMESVDYETHFHVKGGRVMHIIRYAKPSIDL